MHPPPLHLDHRLSDWPACRLEVRCPACGKSTFIPIAMLLAEHGDRTFRRVLRSLRCSSCGKPPAPVFLLAGQHRGHCFGSAPDWAIELRGEAG